MNKWKDNTKVHIRKPVFPDVEKLEEPQVQNVVQR